MCCVSSGRPIQYKNIYKPSLTLTWKTWHWCVVFMFELKLSCFSRLVASEHKVHIEKIFRTSGSSRHSMAVMHNICNICQWAVLDASGRFLVPRSSHVNDTVSKSDQSFGNPVHRARQSGEMACKNRNVLSLIQRSGFVLNQRESFQSIQMRLLSCFWEFKRLVSAPGQ